MSNQESFPKNNPNSESDNNHTEYSIEMSENEMLAREIASQGNYSEIKSELTNNNLLEQEIERVTTEYSKVFEDIEFLSSQDLEIFTIIELYDKELAVHSTETYFIAKSKIEKRLAFDVVLQDLFIQKGVQPEQFLRACLLHDVGKIEIPNFILNNPINNTEMDMHLRDLVINEHDFATLSKITETTGETKEITDDTELDGIMHKYNLRSVHFVPARYLLTKLELEILDARGIDTELSLLEIIKTHEKHSQDILEKEGLLVESELAGSHHNYHGKGSKYGMTVDALHISVDIVELIRIADMTEALTASRSYNKEGFSHPKVLKIILEEVRIGKINPKIAYLWINDEVKILESSPDNILTEQDMEDLEIVKTQLEEIRADIGDDSFNIQKAA
jgi:HD-GYP domain-containing protein (c-di-GMP phosphodiesterase class II)